MNFARSPYFFSRLIAGVAAVLGGLVAVVSIGYHVLVMTVGGPLQIAMLKASSGRIALVAFAGVMSLLFALLCRAVFHIAQSIRENRANS